MNILDNNAYRMLYDFIRRNKTLNHLAHKIIQSEKVLRIRPYRSVYSGMISKKAKNLMFKPRVLEFEVTNKCNARCIMCAPEVHLGSDMIDFEVFSKIATEASELGIRRMALTGGEPLMHKQIFEMIRLAKSLDFEYVHMFTNGSLMHDVKQKELLESGLDSLTVSFDSAIKEEYEKIRLQLNYDKVVNNIKGVYKMRNDLRQVSPVIRVNMVALPENRSSRHLFVETFEQHSDIVEIMEAHNFAEKMTIDMIGREYTQTSRYPCHLLFIKAVVNPHGFLKKCSIDYSPGAKMADLKEISLESALVNSRINQIKRNHLRGDYTEPGCAHCDHIESWWIDC